MKRGILTLLGGAAVALLVSCGGDSPGNNNNNCAAECTASSQCLVGEFCSDGCCEAFTGCCNEPGAPCECTGGQICDDDFTCKSSAQLCNSAASGCSCAIIDDSGQIPLGGTPEVNIAPGNSRVVRAVLFENGGDPVPNVSFSFDLTDSTHFTKIGTDTFMASDTSCSGSPCATTLTASVTDLPSVTCTANIANLGALAAGETRFTVFNEVTGSVIGDARIVIQQNAQADVDFTGNGTPGNGQLGRYVTDTVTDTYTVTVFHPDYNYLTIVGLSSTVTDVNLAMSPRVLDPTVGGFSGEPSFTEYEDLFLDGRPKAIKAGLIAGSIPLRSLLNFDLDLFLGSVVDSDDCTSAAVAGCYQIQLGGIVDTVAPLPGGIVLTLSNSEIKGFFDVLSTPGRRYAWGLSGQLEISDLAPLLNILTPVFTGSGDTQVDFGQVFNGVLPLFSNFASSAKGNLSLLPAPRSDWDMYIDTDGLTGRNRSDMRFPILDDAGVGELVVRQPLSVFTDFTVGQLPEDPFLGGGERMEGLIILTGVDAPGYGFVPMGLTAGLDCTQGDCLDRSGAAGAGVFDGQVNGGTVCLAGQCPSGVPETVPEGHVPLFHAPAHSGLEGLPWATIAIALPITGLFDDAQPLRITAAVVRQEPTAGASNQLQGVAYASSPVIDSSIDARAYTATGGSDHDLQWVTFASEEDMNGLTTRWNVYFAGGTSTFTAPATGALVDPLEPNMDGEVNVTHIGFDLSTAITLDSLASGDTASLSSVVELVDSFAVSSADVTTNP